MNGPPVRLHVQADLKPVKCITSYTQEGELATALESLISQIFLCH